MATPTSKDGHDSNKSVLLTETEKYIRHGRKVITINEKKKPTLKKWTPYRNIPISIEQVKEWLSDPLAVRIAILLDKSLLALDYDGLGEHRLQTRILPRSPKEVQNAFDITVRTRSPHGGHLLFGINAADFPEGIPEIGCWSLLGNGHNHHQVVLLSQNKYLIERGLDYKPINGIESLVTLSKDSVIEFTKILRRFKLETDAISTVIRSLLPHYQPANRDNIVFAVSGFLHRHRVPKYLIHDTIEDLMDLADSDSLEERQERFNVVESTCNKDPNSSEVSGHDKLLEAVNGDESVIMTIQQRFGLLGYRFFSGDDDDRKTSKGDNGNGDNQEKKEVMATLALELVDDQIKDLFVDKFDIPFVTVKINGHIETLPVRRNKFKKLICKMFYESDGRPISADALAAVCNVIEAKALFSDRIKGLDLRVSNGRVDFIDDDESNNRLLSQQPATIYYDLKNRNRQVVKITQKDWSIEEPTEVPTMFYRYQGQLPQVKPSGDYPSNIFDQFMNLINVKDESMRLVLKCYIIALFIPNIAKVILMLYGEKGSAKTAFMELIKKIVDPSSVLTLTFPRSISELVQQLSHNYIAYYDNVSLIRGWTSDALCRAATGTGFSKRELYSDDDDIIYQFIRSTGLSGIHLPGTKPDLLDRCIIAKLHFIEKENRRKYEEDILPEFERIRPQLLGYIFDILVKVLKVKANEGIELATRSRMADWEEYAEIIARCMGYEPMEFIKAYHENIDLQTDVVLEDRPVARAIIEFIELEPGQKWSGTTTELLARLEIIAVKLQINMQKDKLWPKAANKLSYRLNEVKTNLRDVGISIHETKDPKTRLKTIIICKVSSESSGSSEQQSSTQNGAKSSDDTSSETSDISSDKNPENRAQNGRSNDTNDTNDTLHTSMDAYFWPYCSIGNGNSNTTSFDTLDLKERHVIKKHPGWTAYPGPPDLQKYEKELEKRKENRE
jgi:hypothetical protein